MVGCLTMNPNWKRCNEASHKYFFFLLKTAARQHCAILSVFIKVTYIFFAWKTLFDWLKTTLKAMAVNNTLFEFSQ